MLPLDLYARVRVLLCTLHTRPRVQRAPGFPCALCVSRGPTIATARARRAARTQTRITPALGKMKQEFSPRRPGLDPGPITPGRSFAEGLCHRCLIETSRGMGPGFRRDDVLIARRLNRLPRIRHRRREAAVDRDRLTVDVGRLVAGEEQSHRRQFVRLARALQGIELADLAVGAALLGIVEY